LPGDDVGTRNDVGSTFNIASPVCANVPQTGERIPK
jgi:hypothetical protein